MYKTGIPKDEILNNIEDKKYYQIREVGTGQKLLDYWKGLG